MAKLSKFKKNKPIPIGVDGIYIHNLPAKVMQDTFGGINDKAQTDPEAVVVELFNTLVCDENGDAFEDVGTYDDIMSVLSLKDIQEIMQGIAETINPGAKDLGK